MGRRRQPVPPGEFSAQIVDLAHDGRGIARVDGKVTFIGGALPGERVRYRLRHRSKQADEGQVSAIETGSPERVTPECPHFEVCGGCTMQHLAHGSQLAFKQKQLLDALERIGRVRPEVVAPPVTGPLWGYRRRARLAAKHVPKKGGVLVGFREKDAPLIADLQACLTLDPRVGTKLRALARCIESLSIRDQVPQVEVAAANAVVLVFRVLRPPTEEDRALLRDFAAREGFEIHLQAGGLDTVEPLTPPATELWYSPDGSDLRMVFRPTDFIQINDAVNQAMVRQALEWLGVGPGAFAAGRRPAVHGVLELFSGLGNFSLPLARAGARVTAVEGEPGLVERARDNARRNGLDLRFAQADLFQPDAGAAWLAERYDAVLLDPPRAGAREILPPATAGLPARVLYVSCHPGTLARDAEFLVHGRGYRLARAGILDMFPHTSHVESMALFERDAAAPAA